MNVHIVVKGDTLWKIARQYGISFEELKKVNAHLANPDYIVPGMKIFLPEGGKGGKKPEKHGGQEKHPQHYEKPVKPTPPVPPQQKPAPPKPEVKPIPPAPMPKPEVKPQPVPPKPQPKPQPKPEVKPQPKPEPKPEKKPMPKPESPMCEAPPAPPVQQPPVMQPMFIGIPCGWMPIYDADCHPNMHHMHQHYPPMQPQPPMQPPMHQQVPPMMPPEPMQPPQWQMPMESPGICEEDLPIMPGQDPGASPHHCDSMQPYESPEHHKPQVESSHFDLKPPAYCPPEQGYIPQQLPQQWNPQQQPMQGIQAQQHPQYMHLCTSCGSHMHPVPYYGMPMMGMPPHYSGGMQQMNPAPYGPQDPNQMGSY